MATRGVRKASDKSFSSVTGCPEMEYFWATELTSENPVATWSVKDDDLDEDDDDFINHTLFLRTAALGAGTVPGEQNIVTFESTDENGESVKGVIINLAKGGQSMANLSITVDGKVGGKFTLVQGSGPICISGNHLLDYPKEDPLDNSQTVSEISEEDEELGEEEEDEIEDEDDDEDEEEEEEEETEKAKGKAKRKAGTPRASNTQKKAKMEVQVEDDDEEEDIDYDEAEDEDKADSDEEKNKKKKRPGPVKDASKSSTKGKNKPAAAAKDTSKKSAKKAKK